MQGIAILPLGGCLMEAPLRAYGEAANTKVMAVVGSGGPLPVTHAVGDMVQLIRFLRRDIVLPPEIKALAGMNGAYQPLPGIGAFEAVDAVLIEPNTPVEIVLGDWILQRNAIVHEILDPIKAAHPDPEIRNTAAAWFMKGLMIQDESIRRAAGSKLAKLLPGDWPLADVAREVLLHARGVQLDIRARLGDLQAIIDRPMGLVTYIYQYMPDGRPVSWPRGFRDDVLHASRVLGLPLFEPWSLIEEAGVSTALMPDLRHYQETFMIRIGGALVEFSGEVAQRASKARDKPPALASPTTLATPTAAALSPTRLAEILNRELIELHAARLAALGLEESGLFPHYRAIIETGSIIGPRHGAIFELINSWLPAYDGYAVLRASLGEFALLLAASGRKVIAYEPHRTRRQAIEAGTAHLEGIGLVAAGALTILSERVPDSRLEDRVLGIGLDAIIAPDEAAAAACMERMTAFDGLLIDPKLFLRPRETQAEQERDADALRSLGFDQRQNFAAERMTWFSRSHGRGAVESPLVRRGHVQGPSTVVSASDSAERPAMTKMIHIFNFGSCGIHDAPDILAQKRFAPYLFGNLGFHCAPYALSSGAAVQLYDFCVGERTMPEAIRVLAYADDNQPTVKTRDHVHATEIACVELSTPVEPLIGDDIINFNRIGDYVTAPLHRSSVDRKLLSNWRVALVNAREDLKARADELLAAWPSDLVDDDGTVRFCVENLTARKRGVDEMVEDLEQLRRRLGVPIVMKLYDFKYMPDGRAIDWPAGFKNEQIEVARRMALPTLDFAPVVERLGSARLVGEDMAHWRPDTNGLQAELMYDFWADVLGRAHLDQYPEWLQARPALFEPFPELLDQPARLSFPDLAHFPSRARPAPGGG